MAMKYPARVEAARTDETLSAQVHAAITLQTNWLLGPTRTPAQHRLGADARIDPLKYVQSMALVVLMDGSQVGLDSPGDLSDETVQGIIGEEFPKLAVAFMRPDDSVEPG